MRVAALTMAFNEPVWAPVWARHYTRQVGAAHCFLIDHGSDDGSTEGLGVHVERLARSPLEEVWRAELVRTRVASLLETYDAVVHTDIDELVIADPRRYVDLRAFAAVDQRDVVTAVGLDVQHVPEEEEALDVSRPIGAQRRWLRFSAAMCKPAFVRRAVHWSPGFHTCDAEADTGGLFLLHMRYADLWLGLRRLERTRGQAFATPDLASHQRVPNHAFETMVRAIGQLPKRDTALQFETGVISAWLARMRAAQLRGTNWLSMSGDELWRMPDFLAALF